MFYWQKQSYEMRDWFNCYATICRASQSIARMRGGVHLYQLTDARSVGCQLRCGHNPLQIWFKRVMWYWWPRPQQRVRAAYVLEKGALRTIIIQLRIAYCGTLCSRACPVDAPPMVPDVYGSELSCGLVVYSTIKRRSSRYISLGGWLFDYRTALRARDKCSMEHCRCLGSIPHFLENSAAKESALNKHNQPMVILSF